MKKKHKFIKPIFFIALITLLAFVSRGEVNKQVLKLWFKQPATQWNEALPAGNGRLGAMVFGGVAEERLQLNEESVWTKGGTPEEKKNGYKALPKIRKLLFEGKYKEGEALCEEELMAERLPTGTNTYQTLGDLHLRFGGVERYFNYHRELLLDSAMVRTTFNAGGTTHRRTVFSSAPDEVLMILAEADMPGQITCTLQLSRPEEGEQIIIKEGEIIMKQHLSEGKGVKFETRLIVIPHGGTVTIQGDGILVENADKLELRLVAGTDYRGDDPSQLCRKYQDGLVSRGYSQILEDHIIEYQDYFNRVSLDIPASEAAGFATDERLDAQKRGVYDPSLTTLYFQFGRYLLISSSRPGCLPANLQGIWADGLQPPWNADYHININIQMNYWPSEITNLSECHRPFLEFIGELREHGRKTARNLYGSKGFTAHHTADAWHYTTSFGRPKYGMWPMGAAWASTHLWEHYLFTGDKEYLRLYGYPVMREAALFLSEVMVKHPVTGKWITGPSMSPENTFLTHQGERVSVCMGPAMDLQIVWHLFTSCIEASKVLDTDEAFRKKLESQLANLTPVEIGTDGRILEWSNESLQEAEPGHRHMSHLYGLHPSYEYNWNDTPHYMEAAKRVIEERLKHGGGHTGWSRAWMINFYARLLDRQNTWSNLVALWAKSTLPNMLDNHPPFQIDGNFGGTAGIAEMLLQSHSGEVHLLPCLPDELPEGKVTGLMARGGHEVGMEWQNGKLVKATILSRLGNPVKVRYGDKLTEFHTKRDDSIILNGELKVKDQ